MASVLSATAILSGDLSGSPWRPTSSQLAAAVPESIAKQYQNQELSIDLLFVNGIYLLHGKCQPRHHKYIHVSCLLNEKEPTLRKTLEQLIDVYLPQEMISHITSTRGRPV